MEESLDAEAVVDGMILCSNNASKLADDARVMMMFKRHSTAGLLAITALEEAGKVYHLEFTGWMLDKLALFETVPQHVMEVREGSLRALDDEDFNKSVKLDRIVRNEVEELLSHHIGQLLDRAQRRVIALREREMDPARISMDYRSAADYREMARRRYDRGTPDDIRVAFEYLHELEFRYSDVTVPA